MKKASLTYPNHYFIDLAPFGVRFEVLTQTVLAFIAARQPRAALGYTRKIMRLLRAYKRLDRQNILWARKLDMLTDKAWRERVLKDLGRMRKLKLWEAARERILARGGKPALIESLTDADPSWLLTSERIAESERLSLCPQMLTGRR